MNATQVNIKHTLYSIKHNKLGIDFSWIDTLDREGEKYVYEFLEKLTNLIFGRCKELFFALQEHYGMHYSHEYFCIIMNNIGYNSCNLLYFNEMDYVCLKNLIFKTIKIDLIKHKIDTLNKDFESSSM